MHQLIDILPALRSGMQQLSGTDVSETLADSLAHYLLLLNKWNQAYNLTAVRDIHDMIGRHILDSLAILPWISGQSLLDVGTGAGLPGIPLALACPDKQVVLLDSNGKKTRFLQEVKRALNISNIDIVQMRIEDYKPTHVFDVVTSRAFSEIQSMLNATKHVLAIQGQWIAMKGPNVALEVSHLPYAYRIEPYSVQGVEGERYCVVIDNAVL